MSSSTPLRLLSKCLYRLTEKILNLLVGDAFVRGLLEQAVRAVAGEKLVEQVVDDDPGHPETHEDDPAVGDGLDVLLS